MKIRPRISGARLSMAVAAFSFLALSLWKAGAQPFGDPNRDPDDRPGRFSAVGSMNRARAFATATTLSSGQVLVTGGLDANYSYLATAELYDPTRRSFTMLPSMTTARASHTATELPNGQVLIAGGVACIAGKCGEMASAEIYDPVQQKFSPVGNMNNPRGSHTATLLEDGTVLLAGSSNTAALSSAEIYDPATARFTETGTMNSPRFLHTATLLKDGEVLIAGGRSCAGDCDDNSASASAEVYDSLRRQFFSTGALGAARYLHRATLMRDGRVLISGGRSCVGDCEGDRTLQAAEVYEPSRGKFSSAGVMVSPRAGHQAVALSNGEIFLYGGEFCTRQSGCDYLNSGEVFDPDDGTFIAEGTGSVVGENLVAAPISDRQVLIAGGRMRGSIFRSAEVFSFGP